MSKFWYTDAGGFVREKELAVELMHAMYCAHFRNTKVNTKSIPLKYRTAEKLCFYTMANGSFQKKL